jgi:branched-chain amino acid transport system ATP-binding protein
VTGLSVHVSKAGYGQLTVVEDVRFECGLGRMIVILGSNGAGKSTVLRSVMGTVRATRQIMFDGKDISALPAYKLAHEGIVFVPDGARAFVNLSVRDNLSGAFVTISGKSKKERFEDRLALVFDIFPILHARQAAAAGSLSGGQRQMLAIGRALMADPRVLLLDEPSSGLAPKIIEELFDALERIRAESACVILMAEQNVSYVKRMADSCIVLEQGRMVLSGSMKEVLRDERLQTAYLGI